MPKEHIPNRGTLLLPALLGISIQTPGCSIKPSNRTRVLQSNSRKNVFGKHLFSQTAATGKTKPHPHHQPHRDGVTTPSLPRAEGTVLTPPDPGRNRLSWSWRDLLPSAPSSHGEGVDMVNLIGEVLLALLGQEVQPGPADDLTDHIQVPADAAVHIVHDDTLLSHVVLDDHDAVGPQAGTASLQEVREVVVSEVSWGAK